METRKPITHDGNDTVSILTVRPTSDGVMPDAADRRRAIRHALMQLQEEAIDLGMPLTSHLAEAAAEAAMEESH